MGITDAYVEIIKKLKSSGHEDVVDDLERLIAGGSTGGEIQSSTGAYLSALSDSNPLAYETIRDLIPQYLQYCL